MSEVTGILSAIGPGDPHAAERLLPLVYDERRQRAAHKLAQEKPGGRLAACDPGPSRESRQSAQTLRTMRMSRRILSVARAKPPRRGLRAPVSCRN
jgi:hypothetical protein